MTWVPSCVKALTRELAGHAQHKQLGRALESFAQIEHEGLQPTGYTYSSLINAHINSGDIEGAEKAFDKMKAAGFTGNLIVYTTLLKGHCTEGSVDTAKQLLEEMTQLYPPVMPDTRALNTFLRGCVRMGKVKLQ